MKGVIQCSQYFKMNLRGDRKAHYGKDRLDVGQQAGKGWDTRWN